MTAALPARSLALKRVLYATDFSEAAAAGLEVAVALARPCKAELHVVHVRPAPFALGGQSAGLGDRIGVGEMGRPYLTESLGLCAERARAVGVVTQDVLLQGVPAAEIVREAEQSGASIIVMGPHSRAAPATLSSVTEGVLREASCPVIVARRFPASRGQRPLRVLCAVDLGATTGGTLECAVALANLLEGDQLVLHVAPAAGAAGALKTMDAMVAKAPAARGRLQGRVAAGKPTQEILAAARESESDLIVVGSHGGGIVERQFLGSTTLHLLRHAECSVLVLPARVSRTGDRCATDALPAPQGTSAPPDLNRLRSWREP